MAFSLRTAVASLSPLLDRIGADFSVPAAVVGLIGSAPPVCFAIFGILTPLLTAKIGLERITVLALVLITAGLFARGFAPNALWLLALTCVIFAGVAIGNVVLPPLVKKYFPDRLSAMMTLYTTMIAFSTFVPPLLTVPLADLTHWRTSLGFWAVFALAGLVPWVMLILRDRMPQAAAPVVPAAPSAQLFRRMWTLRLPWALAVVFSLSSVMAYVGFAWLPTIYMDVAGVDAATAGALLSLYAAVGLPASLLVPVLVVRFGATRPLFFVSISATAAGLLGLILAPAAALPLWTILWGLFGILFPLSLVLISIRARTHESAVALSGFAQSIGYAMAALFPLLTGVLHDTTGGWQVPLLVLAALTVISVPFGIIAGRRTTVEEEWERRHGAW